MDDVAARTLAQSILEPGEALLWSQPAPTLAIAGPALAWLVVCAFVLWLTPKLPMPVKPFIHPLEMGIAAIFTPLWYVVWIFMTGYSLFTLAGASTTAYALTDQRLVVVARDPWRRTLNYWPDMLTRYDIDGDVFEFDWGHGRKRYRYRQRLYGVQNPNVLAALITQHLAINAEPFDNEQPAGAQP